MSTPKTGLVITKQKGLMRKPLGGRILRRGYGVEGLQVLSGGRPGGFSMFSDDPCRVIHLNSSSISLVQTRIDVYKISPGPKIQWVLTKQTDETATTLSCSFGKGIHSWRVESSPPFKKIMTRSLWAVS